MNVAQFIHKSVAALIEHGLQFERITQAPWIEDIETRLGFSLPVSLRILVTNYAFPAVTVGGIELFANLGERSDDDFSLAPFKDSRLSNWLQANRRIQFARLATGSYDPVCLESRGSISTPVETFDHESILLGRKKVKSTILTASLEGLLHHAAA